MRVVNKTQIQNNRISDNIANKEELISSVVAEDQFDDEQSLDTRPLIVDGKRFQAMMMLMRAKKLDENPTLISRQPAYNESNKQLIKVIDKLDLELKVNLSPNYLYRDKKLLTSFVEGIGENYYRQDLSRKKFSQLLNISERHLSRKLAYFGVLNFAVYLKKYRIRQALNWVSSGLQVAQIAERVGFSSVTYFCSCFKQEVGMSVKELEGKLF